MHSTGLKWLNRLPEFILNPLSCIMDIPVKEIYSEVSGKLIVKRAGGKIEIDTDVVNYSFGSLHQVFQRAFKRVIPFEKTEIMHVLILGFGAGSVYHILRNEYQYKGSVTGVELDPAMIGLFQELYGQNDPLLQLNQQDAFDFVQSTPNKYDLIVIDLFIQENVPNQFFTPEFLQALQRILNSNAILIWNLIVNTETQKNNFNFLKEKLLIQDQWFKIGEVNIVVYQQFPIS